jgi:hypothetical protein
MIVAFGLALVAVYAVVARVGAVPSYVVYVPMVYAQPSPTPTPTPLPPTYFDDFSNSSSGWPIDTLVDRNNNPIATRGYLNGAYQVLFQQGGYIIRTGHSYQAGDLVAKMDVWPAGDTNGTIGFYFGWGSTTGFYDFEVGNGQFYLASLSYGTGQWTNLINPTSSSAILPGNQSNHLKVTRSGSQITLYANGVQLAQLFDSQYGPGYIGLATSTNTPGFDARFDNFSLFTTGPTPTPAATNSFTSASSVLSALTPTVTMTATPTPSATRPITPTATPT